MAPSVRPDGAPPTEPEERDQSGDTPPGPAPDRWRDWYRSSPLLLLALLATLAWYAAQIVPGAQPALCLMALTGGSILAFLAFRSPVDGPHAAWFWPVAIACFLFALQRMETDFPSRPTIQMAEGETIEDVEILGTVQDHPHRPPASSLPAWNREPRISMPVQVVAIQHEGIIRESAGAILIRCPGHPGDFPLGSQVRAQGRMRGLPKALNPGENPPMAFWRRQGIIATLDCRAKPEGFPPGGSHPHGSWNVQVLIDPWRQWAQNRVRELLPQDESGLAEALLLGNTRAVDTAEWDKFRKTGTIHALAISGQHLLIAGFLFQFLLALSPLDKGWRVWIATVLIVIYALITGAQPSANRAALMSVAFAFLWFLGRKTPVVNVLALAWFLIAVFQPQDLTSPGCQLSFFAVLLLDGWQRLHHLPAGAQVESETPGAVLDRLEKQLRSPWVALCHWIGGAIREAYTVNAWVWLGLCPLLWYHTSLISVSALVLGPPIALLCTLALVSGMVAVLAPIPLVDRWLAAFAQACLECTRWLADWGVGLPGSWFHSPPPPLVFVAGWVGLALFFLLPRRVSLPPWVLPVGLASLIALFFLHPGRRVPNHLEIHTLAVGHGMAILIEEPGGRVVLYDGGSMIGGEAMGRVIAQTLWHKGILGIDEVIVSHADSDHFNAMAALAERVPIRGVALGPTFFNKEEPQAYAFSQWLDCAGLRPRVLSAGQSASSGGVVYRILHPDADRIQGWTQNAASLVLAIEYGGRSVLLTGDLESPGTQSLLGRTDLPKRLVAMVAPHHGSPAANPDYLWSRLAPKLVISSEGEERRTRVPGGSMAAKIPFWRTQEKGMITISVGPQGAKARAWLTGESFELD